MPARGWGEVESSRKGFGALTKSGETNPPSHQPGLQMPAGRAASRLIRNIVETRGARGPCSNPNSLRIRVRTPRSPSRGREVQSASEGLD